MPGINSILDIGRQALFAHQSAIEVIGNNIANANTPGYRRQEVRLEEAMAIDFYPGQLGTGVKAKEVFRHFDAFIEEQYNTRASLRELYDKLHEALQNVEILFKEGEDGGINKALAKFFSDWQELSQRPEDTSTRAALLGDTQNLLNAIHLTSDDLNKLQQQMDDFIEQDVDRVNEILKEIASINGKITVHEEPGKNNANELRDKRDALVRELAEKLDINYIDNGLGRVIITTKAGHTLVDGTSYFEIKFESPKVLTSLVPGSTFTDSIYYEGSSDYEYTVKVVTAGAANGTAQFKVSIDGGKTFLKDEDGNDIVYTADSYANRITLPNGDITIWFGDSSNSQNPATSNLSVGDTFTIIPKKGLYWYENSSSFMNITPQVMPDGSFNTRRVQGGSLGGYFSFRDSYVGKYKEKLDAFAKAIVWEVNRIHSQGAGLDKYTYANGTYGVTNTSIALGNYASGLSFGNKLQEGNLSLFVYDNSGNLVANGPLDFDNATAGIQNFDPNNHSLEDVRDAINNTFGTYISASIVDNKLVLQANTNYSFVFGEDTSGLLSALGINTYFQGNGANDIALNDFIRNNISYINAGHVNGAGEVNYGDNYIALQIAELAHKNVDIYTTIEGTTSQTLQEYYNSLVGNVGADTEMSEFNYNYNKTLADDLNSRQEEVSGVNMDEEMTNLIKFQNSYAAAAKLINVANEMVQTLISLR
ncbi:flagellar hook-associated protein 1 FlgK [Desulfonauticus submarinus]|uniref:Flagellar hook-associated protein 1 n=1 Tax=Desulfonauticus submarinus TaxID=206665 RepID=A0A1H0AKR2_9BACT|nr:flagellar hook-associated protein FlgK [Desulfonauticus submarinus]SDN33723.1 flagellar hook-associated protein 1 FlgK [Desulfonauticus submarinus]